MKKMIENDKVVETSIWEKLASTAIISAIFSFILAFLFYLDPDVKSWSWLTLGIIYAVIFILFAFFGDDDMMNISPQWPAWGKKIKNALGLIFGILFFSLFVGAFFFLFFGLVAGKNKVETIGWIIITIVTLVNAINITYQLSEVHEALKERFTMNKFRTIIYILIVATPFLYGGLKVYNFFQSPDKEQGVVSSSTPIMNNTGYKEEAILYGLEPKLDYAFEYQVDFETRRGHYRRKYAMSYPEIQMATEIKNYSDALQEAMKLKEVPRNFEVRIGNYIVSECAKPWLRGKPILEVRPKNLNRDYTLKNSKQFFPPQAWYYHREPCSTEILPPSSVQEEILKKIKKLNRKK